MLTHEELEELYDELNKPYTPEELAFHRIHRTAKNALEVEHAYNHEAIDMVDEWIDFLNGRTVEEPLPMIWRIIRPTNHAINDRCRRLEKIVTYFSQFDYGQFPEFPIVVYCSRSFATLTERLDTVLSSDHLARADEAIKELIVIIGNIRTRAADCSEDLAHTLSRLKDTFIAEIKAYSFELGAYLRAKKEEIEKARTAPKPSEGAKIAASIDKLSAAVEKGAKTVASSKVKKRGKHSSFPVALQESAFVIWEDERKNPEVLKMGEKTATYDNAFIHGKARFLVAGIESVKMLKEFVAPVT